jgi:hypothetical protein
MFEITKRKFLFGLGTSFAIIPFGRLMRPKAIPALEIDPKEIARMIVRLKEIQEQQQLQFTSFTSVNETLPYVLTKQQLSESLLNIQGRWLVPRAVLEVNPNVVEELVKLTGYAARKHNYLFDETGAAYTHVHVPKNRRLKKPAEWVRTYARNLPNDLLQKDVPNQLFYQEYEARIEYEANSPIALIVET